MQMVEAAEQHAGQVSVGPPHAAELDSASKSDSPVSTRFGVAGARRRVRAEMALWIDQTSSSRQRDARVLESPRRSDQGRAQIGGPARPGNSS